MSFLSAKGRGKLPDRMPPGMLMTRWYAKVYQWTPEQVENLPIEAYDWLPAIELADAEAMDMERRQQAARDRPRGGRRG